MLGYVAYAISVPAGTSQKYVAEDVEAQIVVVQFPLIMGCAKVEDAKDLFAWPRSRLGFD